MFICRNYEKFSSVMIKNRSLPLIEMDSEMSYPPSTNEKAEDCMGLEVKCSGLKDITGYPWHAVIFVEGDVIAAAALITVSLLITDLKAVNNIE